MSNRVRVTYETRSARQRRQKWLRLGIWIFLIVFAISVVGMIGIFGVVASR